MLAERAVTIANDLLSEISISNVPSLLQEAINLSVHRANYDENTYRRQATALKQKSQEILDNSIFNNYPHEFYKLIVASEFHAALPQSVARVILAGFPAHKAGAISSSELTLLQSEVNRLIQHLHNFLTFSSSLHIGPLEVPSDDVLIDLLIPRVLFDNDITRFSEKLSSFDRLISSLVEYSIGTRQKPILKYLSTSEPIATVMVAAQSVGAIIAFYIAILTAAEKTISVFKSIRELRSSGLNPEKVEEVSATMKSVIEAAVKREIDQVLDRIQAKVDESRANELRNEIRIEALSVTADVANGARIYVSVESKDQLELAAAKSPLLSEVTLATLLNDQKALECRLDTARENSEERVLLLEEKTK